MNGSRRYALSKSDLRRIAKGAALAAGGAAVTFLAAEVLPEIDGSTVAGAVTAAVASTLLNAARLWIAEQRTSGA